MNQKMLSSHHNKTTNLINRSVQVKWKIFTVGQKTKCVKFLKIIVFLEIGRKKLVWTKKCVDFYLMY
jgi:hypothetical protein